MENNPKKYHVTEDDQIYYINEDGSFSSVGVSDSTTSQPNPGYRKPSPSPKKKKNNSAVGVILAIVLLLLIGAGIATYFIAQEIFDFSKDSDEPVLVYGGYSDNKKDRHEDEFMVDEPVEEAVEVVEVEEVPAIETPAVVPVQETKPEPKTKEQPKAKEDNKTKELIAKPETKPEPKKEEPAKPDIQPVEDNKIYDSVDVLPQFPGGDSARRQWLKNNLQWPRDANGDQETGDVEVYFVIERDGSISNVRILSSTNPALNNAATSLIRRMPRWSPAKNKNKPVRTFSTISLYF